MEWLYEVDSLVYDKFIGDSTLFHFEQKEEITSSYLAADSLQDIFVVTISTRLNESEKWRFLRSCTKSKDDYRAIRNDFGLPTVKLVLPLKNRKSWDANQLNIKDPDLVRYRNKNELHRVLDNEFSKTILVDQENEVNVFETDVRWEIYADEVGLIEKNYTVTIGELEDKVGVSYRWKLISFTSK
jgi:hypothetical protein